MGHAGSDVESAYRSPAVILAEQRRDPLLQTARWLVDAGIRCPDEVLDLYEAKRREVMSLAAEVRGRPRLTSPASRHGPVGASRARLGGGTGRGGTPRRGAGPSSSAARLPELEGPLTLAQTLNRALADVLAQYPESLVFGEDVASEGRRVRRDPGAGEEGRPRAGSSTRCWTSSPSWAWPSAPASVVCCPSRRSSTWPTCTTRRTSCVARRRRCGSSPTASSPTPWSSASPATGTRRASAGTSTTTTPSVCCATSPAWSSPRRPGPTTPPRCSGPAWPRRRRTGPCRCSSSPSRSTTPATCTRRTTVCGWRRTALPRPGPRATHRSAGGGPTATVVT